MIEDLNDLTNLKHSQGYQKLQALWAVEGQKIMESLQRNSRMAGKDTSLRYYAGMWHGFDLAIGQLERALEELHRQVGNENEKTNVDALISKITNMRGETK